MSISSIQRITLLALYFTMTVYDDCCTVSSLEIHKGGKLQPVNAENSNPEREKEKEGEEGGLAD